MEDSATLPAQPSVCKFSLSQNRPKKILEEMMRAAFRKTGAIASRKGLSSSYMGATRAMSGKEIKFGVEGRAAMLRGVDTLADAVQVRRGLVFSQWLPLSRILHTFRISPCDFDLRDLFSPHTHTSATSMNYRSPLVRRDAMSSSSSLTDHPRSLKTVSQWPRPSISKTSSKTWALNSSRASHPRQTTLPEMEPPLPLFLLAPSTQRDAKPLLPALTHWTSAEEFNSLLTRSWPPWRKLADQSLPRKKSCRWVPSLPILIRKSATLSRMLWSVLERKV